MSAGGAGGQPMSACGAGIAYCNDFEALAAGTRPGAPLSLSLGGGANLVVDAARSSSGGQRSVRIESAGAAATLTLGLRGLLPSTKKIAYARMMVWMENGPGPTGHWDVIGMVGPARGDNSVTWVSWFSFGGFGDASNKLLYFGNATDGGTADCSKSGAQQIPLGRWACVELAIDETQPAAYMVSVDGKAVPGAPVRATAAGSHCCCGSTNNNIWYVPDPLSVRFGWTHIHAQDRPVRLWIDDLAVAEKPIGCPKL